MKEKLFRIKHKNDPLKPEDVRKALSAYYKLDQFEVEQIDPKDLTKVNTIKSSSVIADGTKGMQRGVK
jgi:hypothetical protein